MTPQVSKFASALHMAAVDACNTFLNLTPRQTVMIAMAVQQLAIQEAVAADGMATAGREERFKELCAANGERDLTAAEHAEMSKLTFARPA